MAKSVYIVDDSEDLRFALKYRLSRTVPSLVVLGESSTAERALHDIGLLRPDIVMTDISLPDMDGIALVQRLRSANASLTILVLTGHDPERFRQQAYAAGATAIISKDRIKDIDIVLRELGLIDLLPDDPSTSV